MRIALITLQDSQSRLKADVVEALRLALSRQHVVEKVHGDDSRIMYVLESGADLAIYVAPQVSHSLTCDMHLLTDEHHMIGEFVFNFATPEELAANVVKRVPLLVNASRHMALPTALGYPWPAEKTS